MAGYKFGDLVQTGDGSYTILDESIDEEYHSTYGAKSEARDLYMINSGFEQFMLSRKDQKDVKY